MGMRTVTRAKIADIIALKAKMWTDASIARFVGVGLTTVWRVTSGRLTPDMIEDAQERKPASHRAPCLRAAYGKRRYEDNEFAAAQNAKNFRPVLFAVPSGYVPREAVS